MENIILDSDFEDDKIHEPDRNIETQHIIKLGHFIVLNIVSLGIYQIWWTYKAWMFYKQKEKSDIAPASRAIFGIFFTYSLFSKILSYASSQGYKESYSPGLLFWLSILSGIAGQLPFPFSLLSLFAFLFYILPFQALNYAKIKSPEVSTVIENSFSTRQIILIAIGAFVWACIIFTFIDQ